MNNSGKTCALVFYKNITEDGKVAKVRCTTCNEFSYVEMITNMSFAGENPHAIIRADFCPMCGARDSYSELKYDPSVWEPQDDIEYDEEFEEEEEEYE